MFQGEFERFGMVTDVYNRGKGYAFVSFENAEDGQNAIKVSSAGSCSLLELVACSTTRLLQYLNFDLNIILLLKLIVKK